MPDASTAAPEGPLNVAHVPCPLTNPGVVLPLPPARVVTTGKAEHAARDEDPTKA